MEKKLFKSLRSFNPLQVQTKHMRFDCNRIANVQFQSPIGTNKTPPTAVTVQYNLKKFQSPIGTNKTKSFAKKSGKSDAFQSPIGTNKTALGDNTHYCKTVVSIPYRYKQNEYLRSIDLEYYYMFQSPIGTNKTII